jgi:hypothetical protein
MTLLLYLAIRTKGGQPRVNDLTFMFTALEKMAA